MGGGKPLAITTNKGQDYETPNRKYHSYSQSGIT
jgi:hypothetical protein